MRVCPKCEVAKPPEAYGADKKCTANGGRKYVCKECTNEKRRGRYKAENRRQHLKSKYGITPDQYDDLLQQQGGCCAVCQEPSDKNLYVDHCHVSGDVRGLLCHKCNAAIGLLFDDPTRIERAAKYVRGLRCVLRAA